MKDIFAIVLVIWRTIRAVVHAIPVHWRNRLALGGTALWLLILFNLRVAIPLTEHHKKNSFSEWVKELPLPSGISASELGGITISLRIETSSTGQEKIYQIGGNSPENVRHIRRALELADQAEVFTDSPSSSLLPSWQIAELSVRGGGREFSATWNAGKTNQPPALKVLVAFMELHGAPVSRPAP